MRTARKLRDKNLLVIQDEKVSLHPLVREFCYKKLKLKQNIHQKISKYYITQRNEKLVAELEDRIFYHLTRGQEHEQINNTIKVLGRQFIQQGFTGILQNMIENQEANFEELPEISNIFYGDILEIKGEWNKSLTFYEKAFQASNVKVKIEGLIKKGEILYRMKEIKKASNLFNNAIEEIEINKGDFLKEKARAINNIGLIKSYFEKKDEALELYKKSLIIRKEIGDKSGIATSYNNIGSVKSELGKKDEALELYEKCLTIQKKIGYKFGIANSYNNIGSVKSDLGKKDEALELYEKCLIIQKKIGDKFGIANSYNSIGSAKFDLGKKDEALILYKKSLIIQEEIGNKSGIAYCYVHIGSVKRDLGKKDEALVFFEKSLIIQKKIGDKSGIALCNIQIGNVKSDLGKKDEALLFFEKSLKIREDIGDKFGIANSYYNIGVILFVNKKIEKACSFFLKSYLHCKQMNLPEQKLVKSWLIRVRKENKIRFNEIAQKAYESLDDDLKKDYNENEIYGLPLKSESKIGRNEKCHCGSGKKYKQCHGKK